MLAEPGLGSASKFSRLLIVFTFLSDIAHRGPAVSCLGLTNVLQEIKRLQGVGLQYFPLWGRMVTSIVPTTAGQSQSSSHAEACKHAFIFCFPRMKGNIPYLKYCMVFHVMPLEVYWSFYMIAYLLFYFLFLYQSLLWPLIHILGASNQHSSKFKNIETLSGPRKIISMFL